MTRRSATTTAPTWDYQIGPDGYAMVDETLENPRCVWNLLKAHVAQYTPEMVERISGTPKDKFLKVAAMIAECSSPTKTNDLHVRARLTQHSKARRTSAAWRCSSSSWATSACAAAA